MSLLDLIKGDKKQYRLVGAAHEAVLRFSADHEARMASMETLAAELRKDLGLPDDAELAGYRTLGRVRLHGFFTDGPHPALNSAKRGEYRTIRKTTKKGKAAYAKLTAWNKQAASLYDKEYLGAFGLHDSYFDVPRIYTPGLRCFEDVYYIIGIPKNISEKGGKHPDHPDVVEVPLKEWIDIIERAEIAAEAEQ